MKDIITPLYKSGLLSEIDIHFAKLITAIDGKNDRDIFLGAGLVSSITGEGNICLNLSTEAEKMVKEAQTFKNSVVYPRLSVWRKKLQASAAVGKPGDFAPLILDDSLP